MSLSRRQAFYFGKEMNVKQSLIAFMDRDPLSDYSRLAGIGNCWVGVHNNRHRQMVMIQSFNHTTLSNLYHLSRATHQNVVRLFAVYCYQEVFHAVLEYVDLDIIDLIPLSEQEISGVLSQVGLFLRQTGTPAYWPRQLPPFMGSQANLLPSELTAYDYPTLD